MNEAAIQAFAGRAAAVGGRLWPAVVLLAGVEYEATVPEPRLAGELVDGGEIEAAEMTVRIAADVMEARPAENQPLRWRRPCEREWRTEKWWVANVRKGPLDVEWVLACVPKN